MLVAIKRTLQATAFLGIGAFGVQYQRDEGTRRSVVFWKQAFPIYLHYRYTEIITQGKPENEVSQAFETLHDRYAPVAEKLVLQLRGYYLKNAQFLSTADFFLPKQYLDFCKRMQSEVPTQFAPGEAEQMVCESLNLDSIDSVFASFEPEPIGSASIGQVHLATLKRSPTKTVAVKVMGKGVEERFRADIATLLQFCRLAMPHFVSPLLEIQNQFETEFDYLLEAENLQCVERNIMPHFSKQIFIPKPFMEYCSKQVLTMEYVPGKTLLRGITQNFEAYAKQQNTTLQALQDQLKEEMSKPGFVYRDLAEESRRVRMYAWYISIRDALYNVPVAVVNTLFGAKWEYAHSVQLLDLGAIIHLLCKVHAHEILVDGAFSCDSHPGNVMLMPDGRLGLIDFGQFQHMPKESRLLFCRIIVGLAHDDQIDVVHTMELAGARSKYGNPEVGFKLTAFWYDRNTADITEGRNIQQFLDAMESADPQICVPQEFIMVGRVAVMMRAVGNAFGLGLSLAKLWAPTAEMVLRANGIEYKPHKTSAKDYYKVYTRS